MTIEGIEDPPTDLSPAVGLAETVSRCIFMRTASAPENQNQMSEPFWASMISNACCFADSEKWIHEASCHHDSYDENSTDNRIDRFRNNYAPITCERIRALGFGQCPTGGCLLPSKVATKSPAGLWTWLLKRPVILPFEFLD